jgi:hypothetical protein
MVRRLGGTRSLCGHSGEEKSSRPYPCQESYPDRPARGLVQEAQ